MTGAAGPDMPDYGLGTAGLGNLYTEISDDEAQGALQAALESGLHYIDTAPFYGHGLSEQRVGAFLQASDANPVISTKVGRQLRPAGTQPIADNGFASPAPFIPEFDYSAEGVRASFADSQKRLGVRSVDILLLHDIGEATHGAAHQEVFDQAVTEALPEMAALKAEGKTKWIGLGVNEIEVCQQVLDHMDLDVLLIAGRYTLLEHVESAPFLNECHRRNVKIIIGGAFNSGLLAASGDEPLRYDYAQAPLWAIERAEQLREVCAAYDTALPAAALQFCHAHPAVACVIPGARNAAQVRQVAGWTQSPIDPEFWDALRERGLISPEAVVPS
tara:strand:- start:2116 stop:3108 length:993 start_codon:yes stop_codon:yes gene_type:complete